MKRSPAAPRPQSGLLFEVTAIHEEPEELTGSEGVRIADTLNMIPPGCASLLEVGCGSGDILNRVRTPLAFGTDLVRRGLVRAQRPTVVASILALPFADGSVDAVLCAETLEHLDPADLPAAAAELRRVARRHVIVTVPWEEDLLFSSHRCPECGLVFHIHGHRSAFGPGEIERLFPGASGLEVRGSWKVRPFNRGLLRLRTGVFGLWKHTRHTVCPGCGNRRIPNQERHPLYLLVQGLNALVNPRRRRRKWLLARIDLK